MLALARVMMTRPKLLLIDELALGLAPKAVDRLMDIVREVNAAGPRSSWSSRASTGP